MGFRHSRIGWTRLRRLRGPAASRSRNGNDACAGRGGDGQLRPSKGDTGRNRHSQGRRGGGRCGGTAGGGTPPPPHQRATQAEIDILRAGGNAFEAAVAVAAVLNVVEPMMSGMGGYGTILIYDASGRQVRFLNSRGPLPAGGESR